MKNLLLQLLAALGYKRGVDLVEAEYAKIEKTVKTLARGIEHIVADAKATALAIQAKERELAALDAARDKADAVKEKYQNLLGT